MWNAIAQIFLAIFNLLPSRAVEYKSEPTFVESKPATTTPVIVPPVVVPPPVPAPAPEILSFATPRLAWHATRVMCDRAGLTFTQKNILCACIYQESQFYNRLPSGEYVQHHNAGSTDWGIVQVNDYWHIGKGKTWPSVEYVQQHPEKMVAWMIDCYLRGQLYLWSSYKSEAYKKWIPLSSPMWKLAERQLSG